ncbi:MAG: site-specific tyrosine recombinase XerC [Actinobacteria bacterium]|nr:site-specific tyrosine recombinase XerC [Actinomycetota bacterium]
MGGRPAKPIPGDPADPEGFPSLIAEFCEWMAIRNYTDSTVASKRFLVGKLAAWLFERGIARPAEVTESALDAYRRAIYYARRPDGLPLSPSTQAQRLMAARSFFAWLARTNRILHDPAGDLELPREEERLPSGVLSAEEVEVVLAVPDLRTPLGLRDRAIMELLYATGVRRAELARLAVVDLDVGRRALIIRQGKGRKDRMIPTGERAVAWCERYLQDSRPKLAVEPDEGLLFLGERGKGLSENRLSQMVGGHLRRSGVGKSGACHVFRHTMATLMLDGGADIRYIQQMLGHSSIKSTQIYTRVSLRVLESVHAASHPAASNEPRSVRRTPEAPAGERAAPPSAAQAAEALRKALDAEAAEEERPDP